MFSSSLGICPSAVTVSVPPERLLPLPEEDRLVCASLPANLPAGDYELSVGIDTGVKELGRLRLAIEGRDSDGMYPLGCVTAG